MGQQHHHHHSRTDPAQRQQEAQRATWVSAAVNLAMTILQIIVGWLANSQSLVAHGLHSFSDLLSDFLVLYASRESGHPADSEHPYGHARFETAATLILGVSLVAVGGGILWETMWNLQKVAALEAVGWAAFWVAIATVGVKEGLYRYLIAVAQKLRSPLLTANAMHTRADAASALVVVVGIAGALLGWRFLDLLAAALMGFMIARMGVQLGLEALRELIDTGLDASQVAAIRATIGATPGVVGLHELRTRRMAQQALVDAHVQVDARISVSEGHRIAEAVREQVLAAHPDVLDVLVHIDPERDIQMPPETRAPPREAVLRDLEPMLQGLPAPQKVVLHYLDGGVEAELFFDHACFENTATLRAAEAQAQNKLVGHPYLRALSLNCLIAPN